MEFLSLEDPVEVPTVRVSRSEAILLSLGLHLLLVLLFLFGPGVASRVLPESILAAVTRGAQIDKYRLTRAHRRGLRAGRIFILAASRLIFQIDGDRSQVGHTTAT